MGWLAHHWDGSRIMKGDEPGAAASPASNAAAPKVHSASPPSLNEFLLEMLERLNEKGAAKEPEGDDSSFVETRGIARRRAVNASKGEICARARSEPSPRAHPVLSYRSSPPLRAALAPRSPDPSAAIASGRASGPAERERDAANGRSGVIAAGPKRYGCHS